MVAAPLDELRRSRNSPLRFQPVDQAERQRLAQQAQDVQRFRQQRQNAGNRRGACSSRNAAGIRASQSETSRVSDCGEAGTTGQEPRSAEDIRRLRSRISGGCQAASESNGGSAAAYTRSNRCRSTSRERSSNPRPNSRPRSRSAINRQANATRSNAAVKPTQNEQPKGKGNKLSVALYFHPQ